MPLRKEDKLFQNYCYEDSKILTRWKNRLGVYYLIKEVRNKTAARKREMWLEYKKITGLKCDGMKQMKIVVTVEAQER